MKKLIIIVCVAALLGTRSAHPSAPTDNDKKFKTIKKALAKQMYVDDNKLDNFMRVHIYNFNTESYNKIISIWSYEKKEGALKGARVTTLIFLNGVTLTIGPEDWMALQSIPINNKNCCAIL